MSKKCIAIEYNRNYCRAIQARRTANGIYVEKSALIWNDKSDNIASDLQNLGFNKSLPVAITVSPEKCHFLNIDSDLDFEATNDDTDKNNPAINSSNALQIHLPEIHKLVGNKPSSLVITIERDEINNIKSFCSNNDLKCSRIEVPIFSLIAAMRPQNQDIQNCWIQTYINHDRITIVILKENNLVLVRNIPLQDLDADVAAIASQEIQLTWRTAFGNHIPEDTNVNIINCHTNYPELDSYLRNQLKCKLTTLNQIYETEFDSNIESIENYSIAAGTASIYFHQNNFAGINLLKSEDENIKDYGFVSGLKITLGLTVALLLLVISNLLVTNYKLNNKQNVITTDIQSIYSSIFPEQAKKKIVPKVMLSIMNEKSSETNILLEKLKSLKKDNIRLLSIFERISAKKTDKLHIQNISIENNFVQLTVSGNTDDIDSFHNALADTAGFRDCDTEPIDNENAIITLKIESDSNAQ